jgi:hypothetical protein
VWSDQQWLERKEKHKWLIAKNGHLGCSDCSQVGHLGIYKTQGLSPSSEWTTCADTFNGTEKKKTSIEIPTN